MISDFTDFFQYRIFLLPRCTAIHPVFLCTVCSIINSSSSRQHKTLTPWPDAFSRKFSFYFFRVTRRKRTAIKLFSSSFLYFLQLQDICFKSKTIVQVFLYLRKIFLNSLERGEKKLVKYIMLEQKS